MQLYKEGEKQRNGQPYADAIARKGALVLISWVDSKSGAPIIPLLLKKFARVGAAFGLHVVRAEKHDHFRRVHVCNPWVIGWCASSAKAVIAAFAPSFSVGTDASAPGNVSG